MFPSCQWTLVARWTLCQRPRRRRNGNGNRRARVDVGVLLMPDCREERSPDQRRAGRRQRSSGPPGPDLFEQQLGGGAGHPGRVALVGRLALISALLSSTMICGAIRSATAAQPRYRSPVRAPSPPALPVMFRRNVDRIGRLRELSRGVHEHAPAEVGLAEPVVENVEDREDLAAGPGPPAR